MKSKTNSKSLEQGEVTAWNNTKQYQTEEGSQANDLQDKITCSMFDVLRQI